MKLATKCVFILANVRGKLKRLQQEKKINSILDYMGGIVTQDGNYHR